MSDNEFSKLDSFMERNVPQMSKDISSRKILNEKRFGWLEYAFALGVSCIIGYTVIHYNNVELENANAMSEVLEWDVTSDGDLEEVEAIAMLE